MVKPVTFRELEVGQTFKFFQGGSVLTKSGPRRYDAPQWGQHDNPVDDLDQKIIPYTPEGTTT